MVRAILATVLLVMVGSACDGSIGVDQPIVVEEVDNCGEIVDAGARLVLQFIEAIEAAPIDVIAGESNPTPRLRELQALGQELDLRAARFDCDAAEVNERIIDRLPDIEPSSVAVELFLDQVRGGVIGELPTAPSTTTTTGG